ncbi:UNVERIFIED_CONTAM: hypothetical protein FKN15_077967 [Acipenser sinensis]
MASRLHQKSVHKRNPSQCKLAGVTLLSPLGEIQVTGCENGVHCIQLQEDATPAERFLIESTFESVLKPTRNGYSIVSRKH